MKRLSLVLSLLLFAVASWAQQAREVSGIVQDEDGEALIGASILIDGTTKGTVTDIDGRFALSEVQDGAVFVVSYTGYTTARVPLREQGSDLVITLSEGATLDEVVVTGLGIRKEKKALGYGVSTIDNRQIQRRVESDVSRILRGKAAGVDITQTSGLAGSGTNVIIRGYSSITGSNQPLFVVDGVPFNSDANQDQNFQTGGATASSRFLDLDPNNIESISVLKGLSATVLYGEAGRNGVVLVTTKTGAAEIPSQRKNEITVTQNIAFTEVANLPDYQDSYGNGFSGNFGWFFSNWGPAFDNTNPANYGSSFRGISDDGFVLITHPYAQDQYADAFPDLQDADYEYRSYDNVGEFFNRGFVSTTSINAAHQFDQGAVSAAYSYLDDTGFVEENFFEKHNASVGARATLDNGLQIGATINAVISDRATPPASVGFGSNPAGASVFANVLYTPRSIDLAGLPFENPIDNSQVYYRRGSAIQNPRWGLKYMTDTEQINRFFGNINLGYDLTDDFKVTYRFGADQYNQQSSREIQRGGSQVPDGQYATRDRRNIITDHVLNLNYDKRFSDDWDFVGLLGANARREKRDFESTLSNGQFVFGLMNHSNFTTTTANTFTRDENTLGVYGSATVGYGSFAYLTVQGRNDWTSTLEVDNRSIFYPSVSASFVPTEAIAALANNRYVNYLKLRAGYGTSAGYPDPYQTRNFLLAQTNQGLAGGSGAVLNTNTVQNRLGNPDLAPERHSELEFGLEGRFIDNRVGIDLSVYDKQSDDLIIDLDLDPATGFTNTTVNAAAISNKGVELGVNITPFRGDFYWDVALNYTRNRNIVESIIDGTDQVLIAGFTNLGNFAIANDEQGKLPYGTIQGTAFERIGDDIIVEQGTGEYRVNNDIVPIGDPNPNYTANWINTIAYKGVSLGWQFQYVDGGDIYSVTTATMLARGLTEDTDFDRFTPLILPGVDPEGNPNTVQGYAGDYGFAAFFGADEGSIFDGTVIRLREVNLGYDLPARWLENTFLGNVSLRLIGENLWFNAPNFPEHVNFDPEVLSLGVGNGRGFDFLTGPTAKKYGLNVSVTF